MPLRGEATPAFVFAPELPAPGATGVLEREEAHYVVNVCRAAAGDVATATDGNGHVAAIRLLSAGTRVTYEVESVETRTRGPRALLACGAPEGSRSDWLIEKLAELGVDRFQPVDAARGRWRWSASRAQRCDRLTVAALKQSRAAYRMRIEPPRPLADWLASLEPGGSRWVADAGGARVPPPDPAGPLVAACGPASGFTEDERVALERAGFLPVRLAAATLRAETAGLALAALWSAAVVR